MAEKLNEQEAEILAKALICSGWYVRAATIIPAARLLERRLVTAAEGEDGPELKATAEGTQLALDTGLVMRVRRGRVFAFTRGPTLRED